MSRRTSASFLRWVRQDWAVNAGSRDSQLILLWFRAAQWAARKPSLGPRVFVAFYRLFTSLFIGVEFPVQAEIGPRLRVFHPHGITLHPEMRMGADCRIRQGVTIGNTTDRDGTERGAPTIGDEVDFGAGCVVIGPLDIGSRVRVGALAVVLKDVPPDAVVVGNPGRILGAEDRAPRPA